MVKKSFFYLFLIMGQVCLGQVCPVISYPIDGSTDIPVDATITWSEVGAINTYLISIGTVPNGADILDKHTTGLTNSYTPPTGFPENRPIYVSLSIVPSTGPRLNVPEFRFVRLM